MPYRSTALIWALCGSVLVLGLILLGRDLQRAARTGPGWKRRLVAAGLVLLGAIGLTTGTGGCSSPGDGSGYSNVDFGDPIPPGTTLDQTAHWKHLTDTWREAEEIGSGKRGQYPFDEAGKKQILDQLATVRSNLTRLEKAGLLSAAEAGLLAKELGLLTGRVEAMRPTEMKMATCYEPMAFTPARDSLARLADRLPLLEKLAGSETVHPEVLAKVLDTVERDIAVLSKQEMIDLLPEDQRAEAKQTAADAKTQVEKLRGRLRQRLGSLETSEPWAVIVDTWKTAAPMATSGRSTTAQRESVDRKFEAAGKAIDELVAAGLISSAESGLLHSEAERLREQIYREPPTDSMVTCYDMAFIPPARQSMDRLTKRLPLLRQVASGGKVHRAALEKVLGTIEADIQTLSDAKSLEPLNADEKAQAEKLQTDARAAVAEIEKMLQESP